MGKPEESGVIIPYPDCPMSINNYCGGCAWHDKENRRCIILTVAKALEKIAREGVNTRASS